MAKYIPKDALVAEIKRLKEEIESQDYVPFMEAYTFGVKHTLETISDILDTIEVKEADLYIEKRIKECPFRQVACNRYKGTPIECHGRCSWVVDYLKLKKVKAQKGE